MVDHYPILKYEQCDLKYAMRSPGRESSASASQYKCFVYIVLGLKAPFLRGLGGSDDVTDICLTSKAWMVNLSLRHQRPGITPVHCGYAK